MVMEVRYELNANCAMRGGKEDMKCEQGISLSL